MTTTTTGRPKPRIDYPRPQLVRDHAVLFQEPVYEDGQPYTDDDEDDEGEAA
ncbi:hypothetical protein [Streptomyces sp. NPDC003395]